jgi:hypothetical protein
LEGAGGYALSIANNIGTDTSYFHWFFENKFSWLYFLQLTQYYFLAQNTTLNLEASFFFLKRDRPGFCILMMHTTLY